jgi:hypothetical protein
MADEWLKMADAASALGISVRTLHRRIVDGVFLTKTENGRKYVLIKDDCQDFLNGRQNDDLADKDAYISHLLKIIKEKDKQIEHLQNTLDEALQESAHSRERSDTIILKLTNQLEQQQFMLEDMRQPKRLLQKVKSWFGFRIAKSYQSG